MLCRGNPTEKTSRDLCETLYSCYLTPNFSYTGCALTENLMYCTYTWTQTHSDTHSHLLYNSQTSHRGVLRGMEMTRGAWKLQKTCKDNPMILWENSSPHLLSFQIQSQTKEKSWANFAESLRQKTLQNYKLQQVNFSHEDRLKIIFLLCTVVEPNQIPIYLYSTSSLKIMYVLELTRINGLL